MRTYYRGLDARITDECFVWHASPPRRFFIPELYDVYVVQRRLGRGRPAAIPAFGGAVVLAGAGWPLIDTAAARAAALLLLLVVPAVVTAALHRPRQWEVRARYRGRDVVVFTSTDAVAFGKVTRGLRRALEVSGPEASSYDLAS